MTSARVALSVSPKASRSSNPSTSSKIINSFSNMSSSPRTGILKTTYLSHPGTIRSPSAVFKSMEKHSNSGLIIAWPKLMGLNFPIYSKWTTPKQSSIRAWKKTSILIAVSMTVPKVRSFWTSWMNFKSKRFMSVGWLLTFAWDQLLLMLKSWVSTLSYSRMPRDLWASRRRPLCRARWSRPT